jgi:hypothetical protein
MYLYRSSVVSAVNRQMHHPTSSHSAAIVLLCVGDIHMSLSKPRPPGGVLVSPVIFNGSTRLRSVINFTNRDFNPGKEYTDPLNNILGKP